MDLLLSPDVPINTTLSTPKGKAKYKIISSKTLGSTCTKTTILKKVPWEKDNFTNLAQIDWFLWKKDLLTFEGRERTLKSYLTPRRALTRWSV
jgi:hypothetical protein